MNPLTIGILLPVMQEIAGNPDKYLNLLRTLDTDKELDLINIPLPVMDAGVFWDTLVESRGWKLQKNTVTGHARIIDNHKIRRAWGTADAMYKVMDRMKEAMDKDSHDEPTHDDGTTPIDKLKIYKEMLDSGLIEKEEYDEMKKKILEQLS